MHPREWPNLSWRTCGQTLCLMFICIHVDIVKYMAINMFKLTLVGYFRLSIAATGCPSERDPQKTVIVTEGLCQDTGRNYCKFRLVL